MTRRTLALPALVLASFLLPASLSPASLSPASAAPASSTATGLAARTVKTGLDFPAAFTFAADGRLFFGERTTGRIAFFMPGTAGAPTTFLTIPDVTAEGERGLLGLALAPDFATTHEVFAYVTRNVGGTAMNQILRISSNGTSATGFTPIYSEPASSAYHNGGHIRFGPDGLLYVVVGEAHDSANAQNLTNPFGKILRMTTSGTVPPGGNPIAGTLIYAYGIRNSFGFTFDPRNGRLWETENGPECNDELNRIIPGRNYGWGPSETCSTPPTPPRNTNQDGPSPVLPLRWYTPTIAATGIAFCSKCGLGTTNEGRLFFGAYKTGDLRRVTLNSARTGVTAVAVVLRHPAGILSVERAPGGALYFSDPSGIFRLTNR
jgi:glucose/arabinose dehydrogenase